MSYYGQDDWFLAVKRGEIPKYSSYKINGINPDVDTAEEFLNNLNAINFPTTYRTHSFRSSSANDTALGTGARILTVIGTTASGVEEENITMNGVAFVTTTKSYNLIIEIRVYSAGSNQSNVGIITGVTDVDGTNAIQMLVGEGETHQGAFKCPTGHKAYVYSWWGSFVNGANTSTTFNLYRLTENNSLHKTSFAIAVNNGSSDFLRNYDKSPVVIYENETFIMKAISSNNDSSVDSGFIIILVQD